MTRKQKHRVIADWCAGVGAYCFWCGRPFAEGKMAATIDHFFPRAKGGLQNPCNSVVAHMSCNSRRGDRIPTEDEMRRFLRLRGNRARQTLKHYAAYLTREIRRAKSFSALRAAQ